MIDAMLQLHVDTDDASGLTTVSCAGGLDASNLALFRAQMDPFFHEGDYDVLLDCQDITYASSQVFGLLSCYYKKNRTKGRIFALCNTSKQINSILDILGLSNIFQIFATREEALNMLSANR
ncbi:MAG: anti-sigma factor antagonist [Spartobacteria bacterium]|nr:anti-sigma factor antagonist [Spartobacteria bacterium]